MSENAEGRDSHERHEPYAWHEPTRPEQDDTQSHAGNGHVNHSPDERDPEGLDPDELALRRMLHQAVQEVEPREGTLDHLRRAVPARRARKRQAAVGMAAAALFIGTAVPALVHVSDAGGSGVDPAIAGQASQAQGGTGQGKGPGGGEGTASGTSGRTPGKGSSGKPDDRRGDGKSVPPGSGTAGAGTGGPSASADTGAPVCTAPQLGSATATIGAPDTSGAVYGTFRVTNISKGSCTVGGPGTVTTLAQGAADTSKITVTQHIAGDPATALPDPSTEVSGLVLSPGSAYEVKFAWVPSETCPTTGGGTGNGGTETGAPSPDPSSSQDSGTTGGTSAGTGTDAGTTTQLMTEDGGTAEGSVVVSHTPEAGSPAVSATVPKACAGTVYRTGVLAAS
ncbi:hypothetical protein ABZ484_21825 [Streptomyces sp. NPDC006393]|uniref:hypothetical protein n=1 Tax=Streptomyces sp. NPDC006393 TaxID=3156763 RepID=UPI0033DCBC2B